ncbi:membrane lipoprotein [Vibrio phage 1.101.O._10N.261.45.C6]|nr:membrane lipoprotein [Vibrio phage 1.101.O._10N.261.45.C6]
MKKFTIVCFAGMIMSGCTDAQFDKVTNFGGNARVECYSGEKLIYSGTSTGKVISEANSDGYAFRDSTTKSLMEVSGNCVITYL